MQFFAVRFDPRFEEDMEKFLIFFLQRIFHFFQTT